MMRRRGDLNRIVKTNLKYQTKELFNNSTLHGVRYIAEEGRTFSEKFMWFCFVSISAVSAFVIIASLWEKFQTNPTITGLDTDFHLHSLDFPSVILCPEEPYNLTILENKAKILANHENDYESNVEMLKVLSRLSYDNLKQAYSIASSIPENFKAQWNKTSLRSIVFSIGKSCNDLFSQCKFRGDEKNCCEIFKPIYSERGFCYSFNQRYYGTEFSEERHSNFSQVHETDKYWSLELGLVETAHFYMHSVTEVFNYDNRIQFTWEPDTSTDILITMKQTYTTEDAEQLTVTQRKCIFPDLNEVKLTYYKDDNYSLSSCMKECRMDQAFTFCSCVLPFYAPTNSMKNKRPCELKDFKCLSQAASNITSMKKCLKCELSCLNTVYDVEKTSQTQGVEADPDRSVNIEFLTWPIIRYKREVLFGWVDLLVSFGGIAGLFLGFSLLSAIEIFFYFTVRASCMAYNNREKLYEIQNEQENQPKPTYDLSMNVKKFSRLSKDSLVRFVKPVDPPDAALDDYAMRVTRSRKIDTRLQRSEEFESKWDYQTSTQLQPYGKFRPIPIAPYSQNIKPLDRNYRRPTYGEESNLVYYGYLP